MLDPNDFVPVDGKSGTWWSERLGHLLVGAPGQTLEDVIADHEAPSSTPVVSDLLAYASASRAALIDGGVIFGGVPFQTRAADRPAIASMGMLAASALAAGAAAGDLRWLDPDADFVFIAADNRRVPMDAPTMIAFARAAALREAAIVFAARAAKDAITAGSITSFAAIDAAMV